MSDRIIKILKASPQPRGISWTQHNDLHLEWYAKKLWQFIESLLKKEKEKWERNGQKKPSVE